MARSDAVSNSDIYAHLRIIDEQIQTLSETARFWGTTLREMRLADGSWPVISLIQARSNLLLAEAIMKQERNK